MITCIASNFGFTIFLALGWAVSEWLGQNKKIKSNSVYQLIRNTLKIILKKGD